MPRGGPREGFGGKQPGAGRPRQRLTISKSAAAALHFLVNERRQFAPDTSAELLVENMIHAARQEADDARRADTTTEAQ